MSDKIPTAETFDEDYFLRGKETGKSNYENYSWKRDLTVFCATRMALFMGCQQGDTILDYGCSRGYYVKALRLAGYNASGYDISKWAIENCDDSVRGLVSNDLPQESVKWIFCKDVLEHIPLAGMGEVIRRFLSLASKGVLIIVPLSSTTEIGVFAAPQDNEDKTHVSCWTLPYWLEVIQFIIDKENAPWVVQGGYKLPGVKEACDPYPRSVGFITMRKLL